MVITRTRPLNLLKLLLFFIMKYLTSILLEDGAQYKPGRTNDQPNRLWQVTNIDTRMDVCKKN